jgi:nitroreductase
MPNQRPTNDLFEAMSTMRAMRRLKPDPVPDELINKILQAGQWAPSAANHQAWRFMVVKDPEVKRKVQVYYKRLFDGPIGQNYATSAPPPGSNLGKYKRQLDAVAYLTEHYHEAPVWIVACLIDGENPGRVAGASIYGAVQNMCLAIRSLGLGTTLTTRHTGYGKEVDAILGLPSNAHSYAILPIGWPMGNFGPLGRGPLKDVVYGDQWGRPYAGL